MSDFPHFRLSPGDEAGEDERRSRAQVRCPDGCALKFRRTRDDRGLAFDTRRSVHAPKLVDMLETGGINRVGDDRRTGRLGEQHRERLLEIGRKARVDERLYIDRRQIPRLRNEDPLFLLDDFHAHLPELRRERLDVERNDIVDRHAGTHRGGHDHVRPRFDPVRDDRVGCPGKGADAFDPDDVRPGSLDVRAHVGQERGDIDDLRLFRGVFDRRAAFREHRGEHDVDRRADARHIQVDLRAAQFFRTQVNRPVLVRHGRPERFKALDMLVDRARSEMAPARQADDRPPEAAEHRAHEIIGCAQFFYVSVRQWHGDHSGRVDLHRPAVE